MTRSTAVSVTPEWADWWPLMRKRLLRFLRSRGVSLAMAEDVVQDVAERLLTRHVPHHNVDDLMRWCLTVARNSAIDQHRRQRRSVSLDSFDGDDAVDDSELVDIVEARIRLDRVLRALRTMSYDDMRCVMASIDNDAAVEVATPALRARRHRLRRRLSELVGGFGLIGVLVRALRPQAGRATLGLSSAAVASVALVTIVAGVPHFGSSSGNVRLHAAPSTVHIESVADRATVVRRSSGSVAGSGRAPSGSHPAARRAAGAPGLHLRSPDQAGTVDVEGHDRGDRDKGLVCVRGLYFVHDACVAPALTSPHVPPAL